VSTHDEDEHDAKVARRRLAEIATNPDALITGEELQRRLDDMEHVEKMAQITEDILRKQGTTPSKGGY